MATITNLTLQKRNKNRINVFLDDEYAFSLSQITAAYLRIGQIVDEAKIEELQHADEYERAKEAALRLIEYRPRSVNEVRLRLRKKEINDEAIEAALARLEELDLLDDLAFARFWVEQRETFKPRSSHALRQELYQKGVARTAIEAALVDFDEEDAARRAGQKKARSLWGLSHEDFVKKLTGHLQRRGFNYGTVRAIVDELWAANTAE
jgi:regulatory protein